MPQCAFLVTHKDYNSRVCLFLYFYVMTRRMKFILQTFHKGKSCSDDIKENIVVFYFANERRRYKSLAVSGNFLPIIAPTSLVRQRKMMRETALLFSIIAKLFQPTCFLLCVCYLIDHFFDQIPAFVL